MADTTPIHGATVRRGKDPSRCASVGALLNVDGLRVDPLSGNPTVVRLSLAQDDGRTVWIDLPRLSAAALVGKLRAL